MKLTVDRDFLRDLVYGLAVGDALGVPFEFKRPKDFTCEGMVGYGTHRKPAGTWSDDTALALATCDTIARTGNVDAAALLESFRAWYYDGKYAINHNVFGYGSTVARALMSGRGQDGFWDNGNGSLMRIAPLAATSATYEEVEEASAVTHAATLCKALCARLVETLRLVREDPERGRALAESFTVGMTEGSVRSGGYVLETFDAAMWCYTMTRSYRDCVLMAVNLGHDTDTTACVAGALAAAEYGVRGIPAEWLEKLRGKDIIEGILRRC